MRIALTVGHSLLKNGSYTSASGEDCGGVNEYKYNKKLMKKVKEYLERDTGFHTLSESEQCRLPFDNK